MKHDKLIAIAASLISATMLSSYVIADKGSIITYADARSDGGIRQGADVEDGLDSPGDVFVFDQKLLASDKVTVIGRNAGFCIRTDPGAPDFSGTDHPQLPDDPLNNYGQCNWTLSFNQNSEFSGTIVVSGREADQGTSRIAIIGGTGEFTGVSGELISTPEKLPQGGLLFRQEIRLNNFKTKEND